MSPVVAGFDIGGTRARCAFAPASDPTKVLCRRERSTPSVGPRALIGSVIQDATEGLAQLKHPQLVGVACAVPGMVDPVKGVVLEAANLVGWENFALLQALNEHFEAPVAIENDVNAAAVAEAAHAGMANAVYVTISTGMAAGIIVGGRLVRGQHYSAGEIGSMIPEPHLLDRNWRPNGCLEMHAAGVGLLHLSKRYGLKAESTVEAFAAAAAGDTQAQHLVHRAADYLAQALIAVATVIDPESIILGGSIALNQPRMLNKIDQRLRNALAFPPKVSLSSLGEDGPLIGALSIAAQLAKMP